MASILKSWPAITCWTITTTWAIILQFSPTAYAIRADDSFHLLLARLNAGSSARHVYKEIVCRMQVLGTFAAFASCVIQEPEVAADCSLYVAKNK
jgi:hypothetical protein